MKPLEDGSAAVGLFNLNSKPRKIELNCTDLGLKGPCRIRDLWRQKGTGTANDRLTIEIARHGVSMVRVAPAHR